MMNHLPHTVEALLDLFTPEQLQQALDYQTSVVNDTIDDWQQRHLIAAECLCLYVEQVYPRSSCRKAATALRNKLNLTEDQ